MPYKKDTLKVPIWWLVTTTISRYRDVARSSGNPPIKFGLLSLQQEPNTLFILAAQDE